MKKLEEVFVPPVQRVLEIWAEQERNGGDDVVLAEAGRYSFKILARFGLWHWSKAKGLQTDEAIKRVSLFPCYEPHRRHRYTCCCSILFTTPQSSKLIA